MHNNQALHYITLCNTEAERGDILARKKSSGKQPEFRQITVMILISIFQILSAFCIIGGNKESSENFTFIFFGYIAFEWLYMMINVIVTGKDYFELEAIAFFLSGIGLTVCATFSENYAVKQLIAIGLGVFTYLTITLLVRNVKVAEALR